MPVGPGSAEPLNARYWDSLFPPIMENQMEKKMKNEMETRVILGLYCGVHSLKGAIRVLGLRDI